MHGFERPRLYVPRGRFTKPGRFGRIFPELRSLKTFSPASEALGAVGGPKDGGCPMIIACDMPPLTPWLMRRAALIDTVTLVNLILDTRVAPQFIGAHGCAELIASTLAWTEHDPRSGIPPNRALRQAVQSAGSREAHHDHGRPDLVQGMIGWFDGAHANPSRGHLDPLQQCVRQAGLRRK
jgi:hypothetical protein